MKVEHVKPRSNVADLKDDQLKAYREKLKGKTAAQLTKAEKDELLIRIAKDMGYLE